MKKNIQVKRSERVYASVTVRLFQILVPDIAQWVKHLSRDKRFREPRFESPFGQSLFLPSHYIWFHAKPWNWQVNSVQGKNLSWSLQISFKGEECGSRNNSNSLSGLWVYSTVSTWPKIQGASVQVPVWSVIISPIALRKTFLRILIIIE